MTSRRQSVQGASLQKDSPIYAILGGAADIKIMALAMALSRSSEGSSAYATPA